MIIQLYDDDLLNGDGLREVVFLQGCPHHCKGCFNPETWPQKEETRETREKTLEFMIRLTEKLGKDYIDGVTISGGEPLVNYNVDETQRIAELAKEMGKTVWVYSGYYWNEIKDLPVMKYIDVLCEGPFKEQLKSPDLPWVGSLNQRVIDVQKSLKMNAICLKQ